MFIKELVLDPNVFIRIKNKEQFEAYKQYMHDNGISCYENEPTHCYDHVDLTYDDGSWDWYYDYPKEGYCKNYKFYNYEDVLTVKSEPKTIIKFDGEEELLKMADKNLYVINTKNAEEFDCLMMLLERNGYKWSSGTRPTLIDLSDLRHSSDMVIDFITDDEEIVYSDTEWYDDNDTTYTIIAFEEFYRMLV